MSEKRNFFLALISLFSSAGTLICCALPALFVFLGAGAALAGLVGAAPQLIWISEHKAVVFVVAGGMLALSAAAQYWSRDLTCPVDAKGADCSRVRRVSRAVLLFSIAIYLIGLFFAYGAVYFV